MVEKSLCNDCRHLIDIVDAEYIYCEAHEFSTKCKTQCKAYLNSNCNDEQKIKTSNIVATNILLDEYEDIIGLTKYEYNP